MEIHFSRSTEWASSLPLQGGVCERWEHPGSWRRTNTSPGTVNCVQAVCPAILAFPLIPKTFITQCPPPQLAPRDLGFSHTS